MVVGRLRHGQLIIVDRLREMVRLASGLDRRGRLRRDCVDRSLDCLRRFGERIRDMDASQVRVVGTNTLRRAKNANDFLAAAEEVLGHKVEVISGMEEARLIYLGVAHLSANVEETTLVIDIGGGSTELIIGKGYEPEHLESLSIGCVRSSVRFFENGRTTKKRFEKARLAARLELSPVAGLYRRWGWERAVGSSGTIRAAARVAQALGLVETGISCSAVEAIIQRMTEAGNLDRLELPELSAERAPVFAGGMAILAEVMATLELEHIGISDGSLREGLLYDMAGRLQHEDARDRTVRAMERRYHADEEQVGRVKETALMLLRQVEDDWDLAQTSADQFLGWAAQLHEIGLDIAHVKYHKHGAYLLANADLPGFSRAEQQLLAVLVGHHRRRLEAFHPGDLPPEWRKPAFRLTVLLRLAVLLNRSRSPVDLPEIRLRAGSRRLQIAFPRDWLANNHLTQADLKQECDWLRDVGFKLRVKRY
ncbi:MAG: Ppx/GppA family phosphatase [Gammaproteobacteria bacterium]|nr:Ppx/GppA family phosphatase [Gammaproteobacteria bacterium]